MKSNNLGLTNYENAYIILAWAMRFHTRERNGIYGRGFARLRCFLRWPCTVTSVGTLRGRGLCLLSVSSGGQGSVSFVGILRRPCSVSCVGILRRHTFRTRGKYAKARARGTLSTVSPLRIPPHRPEGAVCPLWIPPHGRPVQKHWGQLPRTNTAA